MKTFHYFLMIFLPLCICCRSHTIDIIGESAQFQKDFGYGEERFDSLTAAKSSIYNKAFCYDLLTPPALRMSLRNIAELGDTNFKVSGMNFYWDNRKGSFILSNSITSIKEMSVKISNAEYNLDSLYYAANGLKSVDTSLHTYISSCFFLMCAGREYMLFFVSPSVRSSSKILHQGILVDISNNLQLIPLPELQYSNGPGCVNDFDQDGSIDYACFEPNKYIVKLYNLKSNHFQINEDYYVGLNNYINEYLCIDKQKSKWFFKF